MQGRPQTNDSCRSLQNVAQSYEWLLLRDTSSSYVIHSQAGLFNTVLHGVSRVGWANSITGQKLPACVCLLTMVTQVITTHTFTLRSLF